MFNVVLVEPEIPPNTGNVGRLCLATRSTLHLVGPLGFSLNDRQLKRAGLDYWDEVDVREWSSLDELQQANASARFFYLTTKAKLPYFEVTFRPRDFLVFGRETKGLPERVLEREPRELHHHSDARNPEPESGDGGGDCFVRSDAAAAGLNK